MRKIGFYLLLLFVTVFSSCRKDEKILPSTQTPVTDGTDGEIKGFFLLNEGNMGSNKATLDFFDYTSGDYSKNIYAERNPLVVKELGDVGNDLKIWGDKLYAVINCSNLVEVMDVRSAKHIGTVSIPNCRYLAFKDGYAYVSSYAGAVSIDPNARLGYVAKVDTATLQVVDTCSVGYQPEEMVIVDDKLYVANSGGYMVPNYDNTVSVIDLATFKEVKKIEVAINLHRMTLDKSGNIWVSSRGDMYDEHSKTLVLDPKTDKVTDTLELLANSNMTISGDSLYVISVENNKITDKNTVSYAIVDTKTKQILTRNFISEEMQKKIVKPYEIAVNPYTKEIFITDAGDYVTPGALYCFSDKGDYKWKVLTGDIPSSIAFTNRKLSDLE